MTDYKVGDLSSIFKSSKKGNTGDNIFDKKITGIKQKKENKKRDSEEIKQRKPVDSEHAKKKKKKLYGAALRMKSQKQAKTDPSAKQSIGLHVKKQKRKGKQTSSIGDEADTDLKGDVGFCPPAGIVHESLVQKPQKRKLHRDDVDSDDLDVGHSRPGKKKKLDENGVDDNDDMNGEKAGTDNSDATKSHDNATTLKPSRMRRDRLAKASINRTIFVGNLSLDITNKKLTKIFKQFGEIETARLRCLPVGNTKMPKKVIAIKKEFHSKRSNCVGFVRFVDEEAAKKSLSLNGKAFQGLHIRVDMAGQSKQADVKNCIFVGNLPFNVEEEVIWKHFADCGDVVGVRVIRDKATCIGKGFGYVTFQNRDAVSFALKLNGSELCGREIRVMNCSSEGLAKKTGKDSDQTKKTKKKKMRQTQSSEADSSENTLETTAAAAAAAREKRKKSGKKLNKNTGKVKVHFNSRNSVDKPGNMKNSIQALIDSEKRKLITNTASKSHVRFDEDEESFPRTTQSKHIKF